MRVMQGSGNCISLTYRRGATDGLLVHRRRETPAKVDLFGWAIRVAMHASAFQPIRGPWGFERGRTRNAAARAARPR